MPPDVSLLIADLSHSDPSIRARAAEKLAQHPDQARGAAVALARLAAEENESVREWAVSALEEIESPSPEDAPALVELLQAEQDAAYWAATLLGRLGEQGRPHAVALAEVVRGDFPAPLRERAAWALGNMAPLKEAAVLAALQEAAASNNARLARLANQALAGSSTK